ncbi:3-isopropylmalate dehydratase large subunit [Bacteroidetes bacterium endosymbiont of Geopemphigus sp.]|uniref:3-isopropylmalate dehydratase large subunit n=1 Tax=Bacteroidetes bacterium endosymbiont of Geopemphigus sp. TaxID=2047937 RepID=UPI000CD0FB03|nr:3-isopropylmalate dehydratase large subunit [Bacteroidetes bacterium endosymbiont of Geopemphigus sp.]
MASSLFDKVWQAHLVERIPKGPEVLYIDRHFIHEVTSPQAFADLEKRGLPVFRKQKIIATADHNVPTENQHLIIQEPLSRKQVETLSENCKKHQIELFALGHEYQGIVHVIGPELGLTLPGMTIVCGDSHTSTHGAFGAIAFGIGTSQVAMAMASQCILQSKPKQMRIRIEGKLKKGVTPKDVILYLISKMGTDGATGHFVEYSGNVFQQMSMEGRMTVCNMSIEMGAKGGMIAPDDTTFSYIRGRKFAPKGMEWERALSYWKSIYTDVNARFHKENCFDALDIEPMITYGTHPGMGIKISENIPVNTEDENYKKSLNYMGFQQGESLIGKSIDYVFIGSCTNARIEDLRLVARIVKDKKKAENLQAMIVPGSQQVARQACEEGLDHIFQAAGFEFRQAGCSACLGMNEDKIPSEAYCVSTSNRNFEGRQGPGARTLLASPMVAAITAIEGKIVDVSRYIEKMDLFN